MSKAEVRNVGIDTTTVPKTKRFGHVLVNWQIENFFLRTCKDNFLIHSQDFHTGGVTSTKWKMILNPKTNDRRITVCLRRLKLEPGPKKVTVHWALGLNSKGQINSYLLEQGHGIFEVDSSLVIDMHETENVYKELRPFDSDEIYLNCHLIVLYENTITEMSIPPEKGINSLSEDLMFLYTDSTFCDVVLKIRDTCIRAHKAILKARNLKFAELLEVDQEVIDLSQFKYESIDKVVFYIYSGDTEPFFTEPSIDLCRCLYFFRLSDVCSEYIPDDFSFQTTVDVQTISYLWSIPNFASPNEFASPILKEDSNTTWQIRACSNFRSDGSEYVCFGADVIDGAKQQGICIEFGVIDADENMLCINRILKYTENEFCGRQFFTEILRQEIDPYIENGNLHVVVRIRMTTGTYSISSEKSMVNFTSTNMNYNSFCLLSDTIVKLLDSHIFSDVTLRTNDGKIMSHKCILYARSSFFAKEISKMNEEDNEINVNISCSMLNIMLLYIYSGLIVLPDYTDYTFYQKITIAANYLGISSFKTSISQTLQKMMSVPSVSPILIYAEKYRDLELKKSAIKFIGQNSLAVSEEETWINLTKSHPSLSKEILLFNEDIDAASTGVS